jgi:type I restriction enzyme S subunit
MRDEIAGALRPYDTYMPSDLPWAKYLPAHWNTIRLDHLVAFRHEPRQESDPRVTAYLDGRVTARSNVPGQKIKGVIHDENWQRIHPGDIAISGMNAHLGGIGVSDTLGQCSPIYLILSPRVGVNPHFVAYAVREAAFRGHLTALVDTIRFNSADFKRGDIKKIRIPVPPEPEQNVIALFIAKHDALVNRLIHNKHRLITLLNEEKQANSQQAVTHGLDPDVPIKPSGVEWLGEIPAHWEVRRARFLFREIDVRSTTGEETHLSMSQKYGLVPSATVEERRLMSDSYIGGKTVRTNELVLNRLKAHLGVFALANQDGVVSPDYTVLRPRVPMSVEYFEVVLRTPSCRTELRRRTKGIVEGFWRLYTDDFYDIPLPVPRVEEQQRIVKYTQQEIAEISALTDRISSEIDLIREYRTRLIADVVTGQLDVREAAVSLPDIADMPVDPLLTSVDLEEGNDLTREDLIESADAAD